LEAFIQNKECLIGKDASFVKALFLPGSVPEKWKYFLHEININLEIFDHIDLEDTSDIYPIRKVIPHFRTKGVIKRIELTYVKKRPEIMMIQFF